VLVIGASTGYGLASRIVATFGAGAKTIGVFYEKEAEGPRTASAGWYNSAAFEQYAHAENYYAKSINGDAFSHDVKKKTVDLIRQDLGKIDLVIYSLASPRRVHPDTAMVYSSVLKPIGQSYTSKTVDPLRKEIKEISLEPASPDDITNTIAVMGGDDWEMWIDLLKKENLLSENVITLAYDYIGPEITHPIYKNGTIGQAKKHLFQTSIKLNEKLKDIHGRALLSVNKGLVTQASAAIPVVPLYISLLYKLMKENGTHEGCIEQMDRLFREKIYAHGIETDNEGRIRMDDWEMRDEIQQKIQELWSQINSSNLEELTDIKGYVEDFHHLFGFEMKGVDYQADISPDVAIASLSKQENIT
ncbi:MAG: trans-2-enoyl-CoA reductase family protein, partial [Gammaproteobacteria bacterium]|nr:trans-2-enoyl-CoA reductase family protein [Gammaproteobacteria bacterium]